ncbi:MAG: hypothetical protein IKE04_07360, partial [Oscillospiraceae bacterium]|nr:hypothetical protein [Oscillospiraceae bacterium]
MKKSSKRFLSLLLTALLLAGVFPVQAAAGENGTTGSPAQTDAVQGDPSEDDAGQDNNTAGADSGSLPGEYPDEEILERPSGPLENSPAPGSGYDEEENSSGSPDGSEDSSADPVKLGLKFEDGAEYVLEPIRSDVSLEQLGIVFRSWGEEQEARYYGKLLEVRGKENDVLGASMRDANGDGIVFGALVEFTLSCEAWRGRSLDELNDMELSLYLTNEYGELGKAQMLFNYWDGHPALFFSAGRLEDLLLTEANDAEKARLAEEREAELAAAAEAETAGEPETAAAETEKIAEGADGTDDDNSIVLEEEYPELTYHETVDGMVVDICAPAGAFPAGMTVAVTSVEEETVLPAVEAALQEAAESSDAVVGTQVLQVRA